MVRKISGKSKSASHQHLNTNFNGGAESKATTKKDIADTLGEAFSTNPYIQKLFKRIPKLPRTTRKDLAQF